MTRLGLLAMALALGCNATSDGDTDTDGNSGGGSSASETDNVPTETATATESDSANTESASGATTDGTSSSTTDASTSSGEESSDSGRSSTESSSSSSSSSTGELGPEDLCESTDGTWDAVACGDYVCGVPNACAAIIPGCDCGPDANFVEGEGCVPDDTCATFDCGLDLECVTVSQYCEGTIPGVKGAPTTYECMPMPEECADSVDCDCLTAALTPPPSICDESVPDGLVVQFILP